MNAGERNYEKPHKYLMVSAQFYKSVGLLITPLIHSVVHICRFASVLEFSQQERLSAA